MLKQNKRKFVSILVFSPKYSKGYIPRQGLLYTVLLSKNDSSEVFIYSTMLFCLLPTLRIEGGMKPVY